MSQEDYIQLTTQSQASVFCRKVTVALTPRWMNLTAQLRNGVRVSGRNKAGWGGRGIFVFREDLEPELQLLPKLLKAGDVFVDVGANVGVYSLSAAAAVKPGGIVISAEPFPEMHAQLYRNVAANGFGTVVRTRNVCLSDKTGPMMFWMNHGRPHSFSINREGDAEGLSVLSVRLDDLCQWEGLTRLDYLKIDAEGAESLILAGGAESIRRFRPIIQVEDLDRSISRGLAEYVTFGVPRTRNTILIPTERTQQQQAMSGGAWVRL